MEIELDMFIVSPCRVLSEIIHHLVALHRKIIDQNHRPKSFQELIVSRSSQPQENTASNKAAPSDGNDNCESGNSQPTSYEAIPKRHYPI